MRSRVLLIALLVVTGSLIVPLAVHAQSHTIPWFGPILPDQACPAAWGMVMIVVNNIITILLSIGILFLAPLFIAYAGFLFLVNSDNSNSRSEGKRVLVNVVIGIVIALAGWMIVDAIMSVLYNGTFGAWTDIIKSDGKLCLDQAGIGSNTGAGLPTGSSGGGGGGGGGGGAGPNSQLNQCTNSACGTAALQAAGMTATQAAVMSCIALAESSGNPGVCNGNACGTFQIMLSLNPLTGSACTGTTDCTGPAQCNGGKNVSSQACVTCIAAEKAAALNAQCNAQTAANLVKKNGYSDWTCPNCNATAAACVAKYGG